MTKDDSVSVVVLACCGIEQYALINSLARAYTIKGVVLERRAAILGKVFLKRFKKLGPLAVFNQLFFKVLDILAFQPVAGSRAREILGEDTGFDATRFGATSILYTRSVNSAEALKLAAGMTPDVVVVSGVSILGHKLLDLLRGIPIINVHCGITPRYRGAHGAFWAVVNEDWDNVGATVHFIDRGVDTGAIILQENIELDPDDNPRTLALKQNAAGIRMVHQAISALNTGTISTLQRPDLDSRVYSSPTITAYMRYRKRMQERFSL
jgi:methionyl-tRNA formyltransferase